MFPCMFARVFNISVHLFPIFKYKQISFGSRHLHSTLHLRSFMYPSCFERLDHRFGLFVSFSLHLLPFCSFVHVFFVYLCTWVSENWRYCSVTSRDSVTPRRFSTTPTTRCCLGCGPTAPPTCRGTGTQQPHSTSRQGDKSLPIVLL